jgi:protein-tyrosine-phosphatase
VNTKPRVLFLCTHNAARSQMAEGILRQLSHGAVEAQSAGTEPSRVHPLAVEAVQRLFGAEGNNIIETLSRKLVDVLRSLAADVHAGQTSPTCGQPSAGTAQ